MGTGLSIAANGGAFVGVGGGGIGFASLTSSAALAGSFDLVSTGAGTQTDVPFTLLFPIAEGELTSGERLVVKENGVTLDVQEDKHVTSVVGGTRFVTLTGFHASLGAGLRKEVLVTKEVGAPASGTAISVSDITSTDYDVDVTVGIGGTDYFANVRDALNASATWAKGGSTNHFKWRDGPYCTEYIVSDVLETITPTAHSHLRVWFHVAAYKTGTGAVTGPNPITRIKTTVMIENGYLYVAGADEEAYTLDIDLEDGGPTTPVSRTSHIHHYASRNGPYTFWWGTEAEVYTQHDWDYLRSSRALPNYEMETADVGTLSTTRMDSPYNEPLIYNGATTSGSTWARDLTLDTQASENEGQILHSAFLAGFAKDDHEDGKRKVQENGEVVCWMDMHHREEDTGGWINPTDYTTTVSTWPQLQWSRSDGDPVTAPTTDNLSWSLGLDHSTDPGYPGYLATGEFWAFEECMFMAQMAWNRYTVHTFGFGNNNNYPEPIPTDYEDLRKRVLNAVPDQERSISWGLRTVSHAAAVFPDSVTIHDWTQSTIRSYFDNCMSYLETRTIDATDASAGKSTTWVFSSDSGRLQRSGDNNEWAIHPYAPWQSNYTTMVLHHAVEMGLSAVGGKMDLIRDWYAAHQLNVYNRNWGIATDFIIGGYFLPIWDSNTKTGLENWNNTTLDYDYIYELANHAINASKHRMYRSGVGFTLSAVSGASVTCTFDSAVFDGDTSWYVGGAVTENSGGIARIVSVSSSTVCVIDTTFTHENDVTYDGTAFLGTTITGANAKYPKLEPNEGTRFTDTTGFDRYVYLARSGAAVAEDAGLTNAAAFGTAMDGWITTRSQSGEWKDRILPR